MAEHDETVTLLREIRDLHRSHLEEYRSHLQEYRKFTAEAVRIAAEGEARQQRVAELQRRTNWPRVAGFVVYSLVLIGAGALFASMVYDLSSRVPQ